MADTVDLVLQAAVEYEEAWNRYKSLVGASPMQVRQDMAAAHQKLLDLVRVYREELP
jgi:hypothetical protein